MDVVMTITLSKEGLLNVNGPIDNAMLCYGMLEMARDAVRDHQARLRDGKRIIPVSPPGLRNVKG